MNDATCERCGGGDVGARRSSSLRGAVCLWLVLLAHVLVLVAADRLLPRDLGYSVVAILGRYVEAVFPYGFTSVQGAGEWGHHVLGHEWSFVQWIIVGVGFGRAVRDKPSARIVFLSVFVIAVVTVAIHCSFPFLGFHFEVDLP